MARTILIADPDGCTRERISGIARFVGYRVLTACSRLETLGALDSCPISAIVIAEGLLAELDLARLLVRAPVVVLRADDRTTSSYDVLAVPKAATDGELVETLVAVAGSPRFPGTRHVIPSGFLGVDWPHGSRAPDAEPESRPVEDRQPRGAEARRAAAPARSAARFRLVG